MAGLSGRVVSSNVLKLCLRNSSFKSAYSLDKIYPNSNLNIAALPKIPKNEENKFSGFIPMDQIQIIYNESIELGGPHKKDLVVSKVEMKFHLASAEWIPEPVRKRMTEMHKNKLTKEGDLVIKSDKTRAHMLNVVNCLDILRCMIWEAGKPPPKVIPETREMLKAKQERLAVDRLRLKKSNS